MIIVAIIVTLIVIIITTLITININYNNYKMLFSIFLMPLISRHSASVNP